MKKRRVVKRKAALKVKKIVLPASGVVRVVAPAGVVPVVAIVAPNVIEIAPIKKAEKSWWQSLFG